jgi:rRNA maturation RNase YbeY
MIKVQVKKQSNYPVSSPQIKKRLKDFLSERGIVSDSEVSVFLADDNKMLELSKIYLKDNKLHDVLTFTANEETGRFVYPPDGVIRLGEIVICYPQAVREAKDEGVKIDERIYFLLEHAAMHLLGIHHD